MSRAALLEAAGGGMGIGGEDECVGENDEDADEDEDDEGAPAAPRSTAPIAGGATAALGASIAGPLPPCR